MVASDVPVVFSSLCYLLGSKLTMCTFLESYSPAIQHVQTLNLFSFIYYSHNPQQSLIDL